MALGLSSAFANSVLDCLCRATNITAPVGFFVKLHTGAPGSAGTANAAIETTRKSATMSAASSGATSNSADIVWTLVSTTETVTHVSFWSASTAGTFLGSDDLAASVALTAGGTFTISTGSLAFSLTPLAT